MDKEQNKRLAKVLERPGMPAAGDHARLMQRIESQRVLNEARRTGAGRSPSCQVDEDGPYTLGRLLVWGLGLVFCLAVWAALLWLVL